MYIFWKVIKNMLMHPSTNSIFFPHFPFYQNVSDVGWHRFDTLIAYFIVMRMRCLDHEYWIF